MDPHSQATIADEQAQRPVLTFGVAGPSFHLRCPLAAGSMDANGASCQMKPPAKESYRGSNAAICLGCERKPRIPIYQLKRCTSDNGVEAMGLCSNPLWLADLGKCGVKV